MTEQLLEIVNQTENITSFKSRTYYLTGYAMTAGPKFVRSIMDA
jgi:hypothetical protein